MDKPTKPTDLMPRSFGGIKANWSDSMQGTGYEPAVPAIYSGSNLNYQIDATGKELDYCEKIVDFINDIPIGKTITVDSNNKLTYADFIDSNKANINLDNINTDGENVIKNLILETTANTNLSNLTELGENRLHALKGYLDEGEALTDTELYNDVFSYANSTFDISKFTITGTPKIVNGVASNLSTSNYLTAIPSSMYYNKSNWHLQFKGKFDPTITCGFMDFDNDEYAYLAYMDGWHSITLQLYDTSDQQIFISIEQADDKFVKGDILFDIYYSSTSGYYFTATQNGTTYTSSTSSNTNQLKNASTQPLLYIHSTSTISIDLKTIKFFVDSYPVFTGTQTGLDVIKSDDYTGVKVGNPTINADGILSFSDSSNYLQLSVGALPSTWTVEETFVIPSLPATSNNNAVFIKRAGNANGKVYLRIDNTTSRLVVGYYNSGGTFTNTFITTIKAHTRYNSRIEANGANLKIYIDNTLVVNATDLNTSENIDTISIGCSTNGSNSWKGLIDLNTFKYTANGQLVYQPCLKIPYTQSSTGSKIVDSAYRDRVIDLYEQEGKARYYTIDYVNKTATVPLGEVYGQIESEIVDNPDKVQSANLINIAKTDVLEPSVYKKLEADYHSSFDVSKFTKVGSPVITDDGIASGFIDGGTTTQLLFTTFDTTKIVKLVLPFTYTAEMASYGNNPWIYSAKTTSNHNTYTLQYYSGAHALAMYIYTTDGSFSITLPNVILNVGDNVKYVFEGNPSTQECKATVYINDIYYSTLTKTGYTNVEALKTLFGVWGFVSTNTSFYFKGSINLKEVEIWSDDYPVFNGNKTGLDTIKPDDYTVVGTPTITSDGVASGFSASNYLTKDLNLSGSDLKIRVPFKTTNATKTQQLIDNTNFQLHLLYVSGSTALYPSLYVSDGEHTCQPRTSTYAIQANTDYVVEIEYKHNVSVDIKLYSASGVLLDSTHSTSSANISAVIPNTTLATYIGSNVGSAYLEGSIDLNALKIYIDDNLVYQPCLLIPYTVSKDGKKIVDAIYQDRVIDVYQQYGSALYTVINEDKKTYNPPMGSMQGFVENRQVIGDWCTESPLPEYAYGVEINGSLTNNSGVLSNFSASNYATLPIDFIPASYTWEMNFKVTTGANVATNQEIISDKFGAYELAVYNSHFYLEINDVAYTGTYTVLANTTYYVIIKFTGTSYIVSYSTNGNSFTNDITVNSSTPYSGEGTLFIGIDQNNVGEPWLGTIDLNGCNFSINNVIEWKGVGSPKVTATIDKPPVVVDVFEDGKNGCRIWSDGKIEQWGYKISTSTSATTYTVNFLKPFKNRNYKFFRSADWKALMGGNSSSYDNGYLSKTTSSITFAMHENSAQNGTDWYAFGY